jgi:hypothetical protein
MRCNCNSKTILSAVRLWVLTLDDNHGETKVSVRHGCMNFGMHVKLYSRKDSIGSTSPLQTNATLAIDESWLNKFY